jgi:hypothetical protein
MPLAFPSHQGLVLPIVRWRPAWFDVPALCVGAAMPDVVDGLLGFSHGHLGQGVGHSLVGVFALCWPAGMLLTWGVNTIDARLRGRRGLLGKLRSLVAAASGWSPRPTNSPAPGRLNLLRVWSASVIVGALSHLLFDCLSHENCPCLSPWRPGLRWFPAWWYRRWFEIPLPFYERPYPFAPHTVMWCVLSILGAVLYFAPLRWRRPAQVVEDSAGRGRGLPE